MMSLFDAALFDPAVFDAGGIYPLSLPASPGARVVEWKAVSAAGRLRSPFTFTQQTQVHQGQLWNVKIELPPLKDLEAGRWVARLLLLNGRQGTFLFGDSVRKAPLGSAGGTPLVKGANQKGQSLITDGWPADTAGVLLEADWIQLGSGSAQRIYRVLNQVDSDGGGNATIDIWPRLRESPADNEPLVLANTKGVFRLADNTSNWSINVAKQYGLEIDAVEAL